MLVKIYDGKTRMFPSKKIVTSEVFYDKYPAAREFTFVIVTDDSDQIISQVEPLNAMKARYNVPQDTPDYEAVIAIQEAMNTPVDTTVNVTPEERIAAALEYQNLASLM